MSSNYDKGFGGSQPAAAIGAHRSGGEIASRLESGASPHGAGDGAHLFQERGSNAALARRADPSKKPWADRAGTVGGACAAIGFVGGAASLVFQGNWAAIVVLPILLGVAGFLVYWLAAKVLDTFRGL